VLNLFAYTCGMGLAAVRGGASTVLNIDFAGSALAVGMSNAARNEIGLERFVTMQADVLPTIRQLAGLPVKGRASRRRSFEKLAARQFDCVLLDPPAWAKGPFGAVDVVRDYSSLFKPALLATRPGGAMLVTNNSAKVDWEPWVALLERSARKAGRALREVQRILPETDFPSPDGRHPLKIAWLKV
jgi:23S rRNA (cytosine1962-C5)-methyltransferase